MARRLQLERRTRVNLMTLAHTLYRSATFIAIFLPISLALAQTPKVTRIVFGGSDQDSLAGFAIDRQGNYYLAGTTASLDLPANVLQTHPGGSSLYRFRGGIATPLYPSTSSPV